MGSYQELTNEQLLALPSHRLYNVYKLYRKSDMIVSGYYDDDELDERSQNVRDKCEFIKAELDNRGHIPRIHENKKSKSTKHLSGECRWVERIAARRKEDPYAYMGYTFRDGDPAKSLVGSIENPEDAIGKQVYKKSKKPFKSKNVYNTVKTVTVNPHTKRVAFDFEEDSSIVDAHLCHLRKVKK